VIKLEHALKPSDIATLPPGLHADGNCLVLQVKIRNGRRSTSWAFRYRLRGRKGHPGQLRLMGLGPTSLITLSVARTRARALAAKRVIDPSFDPLSDRRKQATALRTFDAATADYIAAHEIEWRSTVHTHQWRRSMKAHVSPVIGSMLVSEIDTDAVVRVLKPLWLTAPETGARVRARIEMILNAETVLEHRAGPNPARWGGHLEFLLAKPTAAKRAKRKAAGETGHHVSLPYAQLPSFMVELRAREGAAARALEFCILTATRTSETLNAEWSEIDLTTRTWTIPPERMKGGIQHRVPLSDRAIEILEKLPRTGGRYPFFGRALDEPLGRHAMKELIKRMGRSSTASVHGFRSTFSVWTTERTKFTEAERELSLAHVHGTKTARDYALTDLLEQRRPLMQAWALFATREPDASDKVLLMVAAR
jgi:integrase